MIDLLSIQSYKGPAFERGSTYVYIPPDPRLQAYIPNYTLTCPRAGHMSAQYTVLPTASASIIFSINKNSIHASLRGVNTRASIVGGHATLFDVLLIIEFHPGGLYPFTGIPQSELADISLPLEIIDRELYRMILEALLASTGVQPLITCLNKIFLGALSQAVWSPQLLSAMHLIRQSHGNTGGKALSQSLFYSEKQLSRLFKSQLGTGVKTFSKIVRLNHAIHLLQDTNMNLSLIAAHAGYFDQSHFIRDFKALCGVAPQSYFENMSIFYNDAYKL